MGKGILMSETASEMRYRVEGMDCAGCATKIDKALRRMPGVTDVVVSVASGTMMIKHDAMSDLGAIERKVSGLGYMATALPASSALKSHGGEDHDHDTHADVDGLHGHGPTSGPWWESAKGQLTVASGVALVAAYGVGKLVPQTGSWIFIAAMLIGLVPIARRAIMAAVAGSPFNDPRLWIVA